MMVGFLFIGGLAAVIGMYRASRNPERSSFYI